MALKESKKNKKDFVVYSNSISINNDYKNNIKYSNLLRNAIDEDKVVVEYQPIYNLNTKSIEKFEALVRIIDENSEIIYPNTFLDIAKQTRLYHKLTRKVIKDAFAIVSNTANEISVNITAEDILDLDTSTYILNSLASIKNPEKVVFELVESEGIENFEQIGFFVTKIKSYGAKVAIDDFGTGYSNFDYLIKLQADYIKIDGSLIQNLDNNKNHFAVVETIVEFAKKNSLKTIAEFVHSQSILDQLYHLDIDYAQGFFIGKPAKRVN
jgi:EAL domain-containing protein (putative c-di-GMP-specific phosphodiesterase class I)